MTTIIAHNKVFVAADELWTDFLGEPSVPPFKKFYVLGDSIIFLSGDIEAILATLILYVDEINIYSESYVDLISNYVEMQQNTLGIIEVDISTGEVVFHEGVEHDDIEREIYSTGSGSKFVLESYLLHLDINKSIGAVNALHGAMHSTFRQDPCSGGDVKYIHWEENGVCTNQLDWVSAENLHEYNSVIREKIDEMFHGEQDLKELMMIMYSEEKEDQQELDLEILTFDKIKIEEYSSVSTTSKYEDGYMENKLSLLNRKAVKTSSGSNGKPFNAASLRNRVAERKAKAE